MGSGPARRGEIPPVWGRTLDAHQKRHDVPPHTLSYSTVLMKVNVEERASYEYRGLIEGLSRAYRGLIERLSS